MYSFFAVAFASHRFCSVWFRFSILQLRIWRGNRFFRWFIGCHVGAWVFRVRDNCRMEKRNHNKPTDVHGDCVWKEEKGSCLFRRSDAEWKIRISMMIDCTPDTHSRHAAAQHDVAESHSINSWRKIAFSICHVPSAIRTASGMHSRLETRRSEAETKGKQLDSGKCVLLFSLFCFRFIMKSNDQRQSIPPTTNIALRRYFQL